LIDAEVVTFCLSSVVELFSHICNNKEVQLVGCIFRVGSLRELGRCRGWKL